MKNSSFLESVKHAYEGILFALKNEMNFKIHTAFSILVLIVCLFLKLSDTEICIIFITMGIVLTAELFNTAIEATIDLICKDNYNKLAKISKDAAAGAVLIQAFISLLVGYFIILKKLFIHIKSHENKFVTDYSVLIICLLILIIVLYLNIVFLKNICLSFFTTLSSSMFCVILFITNNIVYILLTLFLSILIVILCYNKTKEKIISFIFSYIFGFVITFVLLQIYAKI